MKLTDLDKFRAQMLANSNRVVQSVEVDKDVVTLNIAQPTKQINLTLEEMRVIQEYAAHKADIMRKNIDHLQKQMQLHTTQKQILSLQVFTGKLNTLQSIIKKMSNA
jgi:hypothetical protein